MGKIKTANSRSDPRGGLGAQACDRGARSVRLRGRRHPDPPKTSVNRGKSLSGMCLARSSLHDEEQRLADEPDVPPTAAADDPSLDAPATDTAPDAITEGVRARHLMMIAAVLIGSGAFMIGVLNARGGPAAGRAPAPGVSPAPIAHVPESALGPSRGWIENSSAWTGGLRKSIAFEVASRNETPVWMKTVRPVLVVRCVKGRTDVFVVTDSPVAMEAQDEDHTVRIALDEQAVRTERWPDSTEHDALFAPNGVGFAAQLEHARTLRFGYTPHNASPVVAHFDVAGLGDKLSHTRAACGK